jgi:hypothetical protein
VPERGPVQTIELDCPPGPMRPWDLIDAVIEGTNVTPVNKRPQAFFGHAEFVFDVDRETWVNEVQPIIKPRIEALYRSGAIRFGSW